MDRNLKINKNTSVKYILPSTPRPSAGFSTTSALGDISTAPLNCNSNPYEKKAKDIMK